MHMTWKFGGFCAPNAPMSEDKPKRFPIPRPAVLVPVALVLVVIAVGLTVWVPYQRQQVAVREI